MAKVNKQSASKREEMIIPAPAWMRVFVWGVLGGAVVLGLWAFGLTANHVEDVNKFVSQGWGQYAQVIVANKIGALWHAAFLTLCAGGALWYLLLKRGPQKSDGASSGYSKGAVRVLWTLVLMIAVDSWLLSRNYVKTMPMSALDVNPVVSILKKDMPERRVALMSQDGFYNTWLTFLFPYHGINAINTTQSPRMPEDYKNFLGIVGRNPVRMWQLSAIGYVLAPAQVWPQMQKDPAWKDAFELVYSYNVSPAEAGVTVIPATLKSPGQHVVLRLTKPAPRFALIGGYEEVPDAEALKRLASPAYPLFEKVLVDPASLTVHFQNADLTGKGAVGTCKLVKYRPGRMELNVHAEQAGILRVSEKYDNGWKASIDGRSTPVFRVDYIFQGIVVPKGDHHVIVQYASPVWMLGVQLLGLGLVLGAAVWLVVGKWRNKG